MYVHHNEVNIFFLGDGQNSPGRLTGLGANSNLDSSVFGGDKILQFLSDASHQWFAILLNSFAIENA